MFRTLHVLTSDLKAGLVALLKDRSGNFGIVTVLLIVPLLGLAGTAVDLARLSEIRERIQQAADATVLDAVSARNWHPYLSPNANIASLNRALETKAVSMFRGLLQQQELDSYPITAKASAEVVNKRLQFELSYAASMPTTFLGVLGYSNLPVSGVAKSTPVGLKYVNIHFLIDNSPSMGIAASIAEAVKLVNMSYEPVMPPKYKGGCMFACHVQEIWKNDRTGLIQPDIYTRAKNLGVVLRIDLVKSMLGQFASLVETMRSVPDQFKVAYYTLGSDSDRKYYAYNETIGTLTADIPLMKSNISKIELMKYLPGYNLNAPYSELHQFGSESYLAEGIEAMNKYIPGSQDGSAADKPEQMLVFITDGIANHIVPPGKCKGVKVDSKVSCVEPVDPAACDALKNKGVKVAIIEMNYYDITYSGTWADTVRPFHNSGVNYWDPRTDYVVPALTSCASDGLFFHIYYFYDKQTITNAIQQIMNSFIGGSRLTD